MQLRATLSTNKISIVGVYPCSKMFLHRLAFLHFDCLTVQVGQSHQGGETRSASGSPQPGQSLLLEGQGGPPRSPFNSKILIFHPCKILLISICCTGRRQSPEENLQESGIRSGCELSPCFINYVFHSRIKINIKFSFTNICQ